MHRPGPVWYGEGEVKIYRDGDTDYPTICGTGLEDYVGSAWGMGPHVSFYAGSQLDVRPAGTGPTGNPDFLGFYRWHVVDPIMFERELRVTIQQIGYDLFWQGQEARVAEIEQAGLVAGNGLTMVNGDSSHPVAGPRHRRARRRLLRGRVHRLQGSASGPATERRCGHRRHCPHRITSQSHPRKRWRTTFTHKEAEHV